MPYTNSYLEWKKQRRLRPEFDLEGNVIGTYDPYEEVPKEVQPNYEKTQYHLDYLAQKYNVPYFTPEVGEPLEEFDYSRPSSGVLESVSNTAKYAFNESLVGLVVSLLKEDGETPFDVSDWEPTETEAFAGDIVSLMADSPAFALGGGIGGAVGKTVAKQAVKGMLKQGIKKNLSKTAMKLLRRSIKAIPASSGAFGFHSGAGSTLRQQRDTGEIDIGEVALETLKGGATGAAVGITGGAAAKVFGRGFTNQAARFATEASTFGAVTPVLEGRMPTQKDFADSFKMILGFKIGHAIKSPRRTIQNIERMSRNAFASFKERKAKGDTTPNDEIMKQETEKQLVKSQQQIKESIQKKRFEAQKQKERKAAVIKAEADKEKAKPKTLEEALTLSLSPADVKGKVVTEGKRTNQLFGKGVETFGFSEDKSTQIYKQYTFIGSQFNQQSGKNKGLETRNRRSVLDFFKNKKNKKLKPISSILNRVEGWYRDQLKKTGYEVDEQSGKYYVVEGTDAYKREVELLESANISKVVTAGTSGGGGKHKIITKAGKKVIVGEKSGYGKRTSFKIHYLKDAPPVESKFWGRLREAIEKYTKKKLPGVDESKIRDAGADITKPKMTADEKAFNRGKSIIERIYRKYVDRDKKTGKITLKPEVFEKESADKEVVRMTKELVADSPSMAIVLAGIRRDISVLYNKIKKGATDPKENFNLVVGSELSKVQREGHRESPHTSIVIRAERLEKALGEPDPDMPSLKNVTVRTRPISKEAGGGVLVHIKNQSVDAYFKAGGDKIHVDVKDVYKKIITELYERKQKGKAEQKLARDIIAQKAEKNIPANDKIHEFKYDDLEKKISKEFKQAIDEMLPGKRKPDKISVFVKKSPTDGTTPESTQKHPVYGRQRSGYVLATYKVEKDGKPREVLAVLDIYAPLNLKAKGKKALSLMDAYHDDIEWMLVDLHNVGAEQRKNVYFSSKFEGNDVFEYAKGQGFVGKKFKKNFRMKLPQSIREGMIVNPVTYMGKDRRLQVTQAEGWLADHLGVETFYEWNSEFNKKAGRNYRLEEPLSEQLSGKDLSLYRSFLMYKVGVLQGHNQKQANWRAMEQADFTKELSSSTQSIETFGFSKENRGFMDTMRELTDKAYGLIVKTTDKRTGETNILVPRTIVSRFFRDLNIAESEHFVKSEAKEAGGEAHTRDTNLGSRINSIVLSEAHKGDFGYAGHEVFHIVHDYFYKGVPNLDKHVNELRNYGQMEGHAPSIKRQERFARFGNDFFVYPERAKRLAPELHKDIMLWLNSPRYKHIGKAFRGFEAEIAEWKRGLGKEGNAKEVFEAVYKQPPVPEKGAPSKLMNLMKKFYQRAVYGGNSFYEFVLDIERKSGRSLEGAQNPEQLNKALAKHEHSQLTQTLHGRPFIMRAVKDAKGNLIDIKYEHTGDKNMAEIIEGLKTTENTEWMFDVLAAETTIKWNNRKAKDGTPAKLSTGIEVEAAEKLMKEYKGLPEKQKILIEKGIEGYNKLKETALQQMVESGFYTQKDVDNARNYNPFYTPIYKESKHLGDYAYNLPSGTAVFTKPVKHAAEKTGTLIHPAQSVVDMFESMYRGANRYMIMQQLRNINKGVNPELGKEYGLGKSFERIQGASLERVVEARVEMRTLVEEMKKNGIKVDVEAKIDELMLHEAYARNIIPEGENILPIRGPKGMEYYKVDSGLMDSVYHYNNYQLGARTYSIISAPTKLIKALAVQYNYKFQASNVIRDFIGAWVFSQNKLTLKQLVKGYVDSFNFVFKGKSTPIVDMFEMAGITQSYLQTMDDHMSRGHQGNELLKLNAKKKSYNLLKHAMAFLRKTGAVSEMGARLAETEAAHKAGKSWVQAINEGRDVSIDFLRTSQLSSALSMVIPFFNPAVQGLDRLRRVVMSKDIEYRNHVLRRAATSILAPTLMLWALNKDEEWYKNLSPKAKVGNWFFKMPFTDEVVKLPKPFDVGMAFGGLPETLLNFVNDKDPEAALDAAEGILGRMMPADFSPSGVVAQMAWLRPMLEYQANYDFYWDDRVVDYFTQQKPEQLQYYKNTPNIWRAFGYLGFSPLKIKKLFSTISAGQTDTFAKGSDWVVNQFLPERKKNSAIFEKIERGQTEIQNTFGWVPFVATQRSKETIKRSKEAELKRVKYRLKLKLEKKLITRAEYNKEIRKAKKKYSTKRGKK